MYLLGQSLQSSHRYGGRDATSMMGLDSLGVLLAESGLALMELAPVPRNGGSDDFKLNQLQYHSQFQQFYNFIIW